MAKFPTADSLGPTPAVDANRGVAGYDLGPIAQGNRALEAGGDALGAGVDKAGAGAADLADAKTRYQFMLAHADYLAKAIDLHSSFANDQDFATLPDRYNAAATALRDQTAQTIDSPGLRGRFLATADDTIARGNAWAKSRAADLSNNNDIATVAAQGDQLAGTFAGTQDEPTRHQIIGTYGALVGSLADKGAVTPVQAYEMQHRWGHQVASADALTRIQNGDAEGVLNELRSAPSSNDQIDNRIVQIESTGNPLANPRVPGSHAFGLGQFEPDTWRALIKQTRPELADLPDDQLLALRADPALSREMVGALREQNTAYLKNKGVDATPGNIYLAHFLGPAGAAAIAQASPNMPASMVLSGAVGPDKAAAMVRANPSVLSGMTAGSVSQWANDRMGGVGPGGGHLYDLLRPDERAELEQHALGAIQKQTATGLSDLKSQVDDTLAEANVNGAPKNPVPQEVFVARLGPQAGIEQYQRYTAALATAADVSRVGQMSLDQQEALYQSYAPKAGADGFAEQLARQQQLGTAIKQSRDALAKDPAAFAIQRLPAVTDAYGAFAAKQADPTASPDDKQAAARDFALKQTIEQQRVGVAPDDVRILPKAYIDNFNKAVTQAAGAEDPNARVALIGRVQQEAALWGNNWPAVMRELAPGTQPMVRAIAAGADPTAMTRLLSLGKDEKPAALLKEQSETKAADVTKAVDGAMAPFFSTLVGRQRDRDFTGYYNLATNLAALYVRDGQSASEAATKAFNDLVGKNYDFRDTYRIPKSSGAAPDDVQAGAQAARLQLGSFNVKPAIDDIGLGAGNAQDSLTKFGRDGKWVTAPDQSGLNLAYGDKFVRTNDGAPLKLTWDQLGKLGAGRKADVARETAAAPQL
jgi:hypothetical protein